MGAHTVAMVALLALICPPLLAAAEAGSPLEEFGKCRTQCNKKYWQCSTGNTDISVMEQCFFEYDLECTCACKRYLPAGPTRVAPKTAAPSPPRAPAVLREGMFSDDYEEAYYCNNNALVAMSDCITPCEATQDKACATACMRPYVEKVCRCDKRGSTKITPELQS